MKEHIYRAKFIELPEPLENGVAVYRKEFEAEDVVSAVMSVSALGTYKPFLNGEEVGKWVMAPGWTSYSNRIQFQNYELNLKKGKNVLEISVGIGWTQFDSFHSNGVSTLPVIASVALTKADGTVEYLTTDETWLVSESPIRFSTIYDGEIYDANFVPSFDRNAVNSKLASNYLVPQEGEDVTTHERIAAQKIITTPLGETVLDFGQEVTGYVEFNICGKQGASCCIKHAEVLDAAGNFYTENLRSAKQEMRFICDGKPHTHKALHTFFGFRFIRLEDWPEEVKLENFTAVVVHSDMKRTGWFECSDPMVNRLFQNTVWGQKGNFLDVPTDCPQRDERLGWTGDAQVFSRTAAYIFDVERFFKKWLEDLNYDQFANGMVPNVIPNTFTDRGGGSSAWSDCATVIPWQMYLAYGDKALLLRQFRSMKKWVDYIEQHCTDDLWVSEWHFGDWLTLDGYKTTNDVVACAYAVYSTWLLVNAGHVLGLDVSHYEERIPKLKAAFCRTYMENGVMKVDSQTGCVLTLAFEICPEEDRPKVAAQLNRLVCECGHLETGFVGTPFLNHVLCKYGYSETAYMLLLRREYPGWLYPITQGATTIWEHWDGLKPDGTMWSAEMNSFNHYAYGAV
ncbi:MAG TPA: alfa-L-rhamnosidase, partial [Ruminococcaceae bacterium]|nr:alfa-L-rhamnosidase [Oscillospiraceae bacterium]